MKPVVITDLDILQADGYFVQVLKTILESRIHVLCKNSWHINAHCRKYSHCPFKNISSSSVRRATKKQSSILSFLFSRRKLSYASQWEKENAQVSYPRLASLEINSFVLIDRNTEYRCSITVIAKNHINQWKVFAYGIFCEMDN